MPQDLWRAFFPARGCLGLNMLANHPRRCSRESYKDHGDSAAVNLIEKRIFANVVKMFNVIRVTLFLAATVNAALSPSSIDSDLSILIHNDLLGTSLLIYEDD